MSALFRTRAYAKKLSILSLAATVPLTTLASTVQARSIPRPIPRPIPKEKVCRTIEPLTQTDPAVQALVQIVRRNNLNLGKLKQTQLDRGIFGLEVLRVAADLEQQFQQTKKPIPEEEIQTLQQLNAQFLPQITDGSSPGFSAEYLAIMAKLKDSKHFPLNQSWSGNDQLFVRLAPRSIAVPPAGIFVPPAASPVSPKVMGGAVGGNIRIAPVNSLPIARPNPAPADRPIDTPIGNTEGYSPIDENPFQRPTQTPLSTFSIDVDTASYSNTRRMIQMGQTPPKDAVRLEELINYFPYRYPQPTDDRPFSVTTEVTQAPWNRQHQLVRIGLKGKQLQTMPPSNLVFLVDVSGSMNAANKLPLVKRSLCLLAKQMGEADRISLVAYAGNAGLVLPPTSGANKETIYDAIDNLEAGGSTAGGAGIELAYKQAQQTFLKNGNNRVILATDGDFNVGVSSDAELVRMIEQKRDRGIFLTVLGFGSGNYKDSKMEQLADKGNGNYAYIDTEAEAKKVLVNDLRGTLFTIAKDVKIQVEFNPAKVQAYRLIGYENRALKDQDFNDDRKDAGEIGAGHSVTALYEIIPPGITPSIKLPSVDDLKYQKPQESSIAANARELMQVKLRYKSPTGSESQLLTQPIGDRVTPFESSSSDLQFASAVAMFGMMLRDSEFKGNASMQDVIQLAQRSREDDPEGYRSDFIKLVERHQKNVLQANRKPDGDR